MKPKNQYSDPIPSYFENATTTVDFMEEQDEIIPVWTPPKGGVLKNHVYSNRKTEGYYSRKKNNHPYAKLLKPGKAFLMGTLGFIVGWRLATRRKKHK